MRRREEGPGYQSSSESMFIFVVYMAVVVIVVIILVSQFTMSKIQDPTLGQ